MNVIVVRCIDCFVDLIGYVVYLLYRVFILNIFFGIYNLIFFDRLKIGKLTIRNIINVVGLAEVVVVL